jgi:AraC-like DNA-binding protein
MFTLILDKTLKETTVQGTQDFPYEVYNGGVSRFDKGYLDWHWHDYFEINLVTSGTLNYFIENQSYVLHEGDAIFINARRLHRGYSDNPSQDSDTIVFGGNLFCSDTSSEWYQSAVENFIRSAVNGIKISAGTPWMERILTGLLQIHAAYRQKTVGYELSIKGYLCNIFSEILQNTAADTAPTILETEKMGRMRTLLAYIAQNYQNDFSLSDLAAEIGISDAECSRFFTSQMHQTLFTFITHYRIERSCELLINTDIPISEIALQAGFNSFSYYSRRFKEKMQCTPSEYRKKIRPIVRCTGQYK